MALETWSTQRLEVEVHAAADELDVVVRRRRDAHRARRLCDVKNLKRHVFAGLDLQFRADERRASCVRARAQGAGYRPRAGQRSASKQPLANFRHQPEAVRSIEACERPLMAGMNDWARLPAEVDPQSIKH